MTYTQNIKLSKEQEKRIKEIFTPEYIIESSKAISIEKQQDSVIAARDEYIKELEAKIEALNTEHKRTLAEIAKANNVVKETIKESDSIADKQLKDERLRWSGIHFYGGVEVPEIDFQRTEINGELMYELEKFHFGLKAAFRQEQIEQQGLQFTYFIKLRYKFF